MHIVIIRVDPLVKDIPVMITHIFLGLGSLVTYSGWSLSKFLLGDNINIVERKVQE